MLALAGLALIAAACSSGDGAEEADGAPSTRFEPKPTITLVVSNWTASALNAAVAEQLIERHLGYPVVPARLDDTTQIYDGLADGTIDAVLEIWPSDVTERDRIYFDRGEVVDLGPLGPVGKVGWYVPRYVLDDHPELATWEGLADPSVAEQFATSETGRSGRLLGTSEDYLQFDAEIIDNLDLPLELVFSGSEEATLLEVAASVEGRQPILVYWWTPTAAVAEYDLVNVRLPEPTEACLAAAAAGGAGVDCDYPDEILFKAASPDLAVKAPDVDALLRAFSLSTADQTSMLAAVEIGGQTIDAAAATWIEANESTWRTWLPGGS